MDINVLPLAMLTWIWIDFNIHKLVLWPWS